MTQEELAKIELFDLFDMMVKTMNELFALDNTPANADTITEKKTYLLLLQNVIVFKRLENVETIPDRRS